MLFTCINSPHMPFNTINSYVCHTLTLARRSLFLLFRWWCGSCTIQKRCEHRDIVVKTGSRRTRVVLKLSPSEMAIDLIGRLDRRVTKLENHVLKALVFSSDHAESDRMSEGMGRHLGGIAPTAPGNVGPDAASWAAFFTSRRMAVLLT